MSDFDQFWAACPRKVGKLAALRAWHKALRIAPPSEIVEGMIRFAREVRSRERQFIPHPATWLNQGRWMDEPEHNSPEPTSSTAGFRPSTIDWGARVKMWRSSKVWLSSWGPEPGDAGCECPREFLDRQPQLRTIAGGR